MVVLKSYHAEPNGAHHWIGEVLGYMLVPIKSLYPFLDSLHLLTKCAPRVCRVYYYSMSSIKLGINKTLVIVWLHSTSGLSLMLEGRKFLMGS